MNGTPNYEAAEAGATAALEHAGPAWAEEAFQAFCYYASKNESFLTDDVRIFAYGFGLQKPPDDRAWGGVVNRAKRLGLIERIGFAPVKSPNNHARPMPVWRLVK